MPSSTVTSKGQVTIPKEVRDRLRIGAGDRLSFIVRDDGVVELRPLTADLKVLYGVLEYNGKPRSVEEIDEAIRSAAAEPVRRTDRG